MEKFRRQYINEIDVQISSLLKKIERNKYYFQSFQGQKLPDNLSKKKDEVEKEIENMEIRIEDLKKKRIEYSLGQRDFEIKEELKKNEVKKVVKEKPDNKKHEKKKEINEKLNYEEKRNERDAENSWYMFNKAIDTMPDYMKKNLKDMPNNKGYVWRGCWFFGEKKCPYIYPTVLFEKMKNKKLRIHELTKNEYKIYDKEGENRKYLVSTKQRNLNV